MIVKENKIEKYKKFAECLMSNLSCEVRNYSLYHNDCAIYASIRYDRCCLVMGRQKGKTNFTLVHAIREAMIKGGRNIVIYVSNENCIKICRERLAEMLNPLYLVSDTSNNKYNLVNGSSITLRQTIDTETNYDLVIIDDICWFSDEQIRGLKEIKDKCDNMIIVTSDTMNKRDAYNFFEDIKNDKSFTYVRFENHEEEDEV
ncbi:MAG: terminase family protein [Paludibacteraceae bacterium]|nr:terminase family protein [Paludibacteraceae bacterium]